METFRAGASRLCITPDPSYFPVEHFNNRATGKPSVFNGTIRENIFLRTIVLDSEQGLFVIAVLDLPGVPEAPDLRALIAQQADTPLENVILTCTHNHSGLYADNPVFERWFSADFSEKVHRYRTYLREAAPVAVQQALDSLQPAQVGIAAGESYLNVCRNESALGKDAGTYGFMPGVAVDRRLTALELKTLNGDAIAVLLNYPVHACAMIHNQPTGNGTEISGDFVGHACCLLEEKRPGCVVAFTSGAAGDLNPIMMARVNIPKTDGSIATKDLGEGGPAVLEFMGTRFAMDAERVLESITEYDASPALQSTEEEFTLPHSAVVLPGPPDPVDFHVGFMRIGNAGIIFTNGEVFNQIGIRLKHKLPLRYPIVITHTGTWSGYVKDDSGVGLFETAATQAVEHNLLALGLR